MSQFEMIISLMGILMCWVLLPLVPAILIYRLFPDTPLTLSGPLAGLTLKTGSAFGAYLIIFLLVIPRVQDAYAVTAQGQHGAWTITGAFHTVKRNGEDWAPGNDFFSKIAMRTEPRISSFSENFTIHIPEVEGGIPRIYLDIGQGYTVPIQVQKNLSVTKIIELPDPILIKEQITNESRDSELITETAKR
jgi:hypothetical protein